MAQRPVPAKPTSEAAPARPGLPKAPALFILGGLLGCLVWSYWGSLCEIAGRWERDPQYSHGYLVPVFALALLWLRRKRLDAVALVGAWWGLAVLLLGVALHLWAGYYYYEAAEVVSLLPVLAGVCLCVGGWPLLRWAGPSIAFLVFMFPLPFRLEMALSHPLRRMATGASTYALQTLGLPAVAEGNTILMDDVRVGVVEACSGLGMLVTFFAVTAGVALLLRRGWVSRVAVLLSAVPIALVANLLRITVTALLAYTVSPEAADLVFHDLAGWLMMPLALGLVWVELRVFDRLVVEAPAPADAPLDFGGPAWKGELAAVPARGT